MFVRFSVLKSAAVLFIAIILCCSSEAVTSKITRHSSAAEFELGKTDNAVISSKGILQLGNSNHKLADDIQDVWSINSIVLSGGKIYVGTSPNGGLYEYSLGKLNEIYSAKSVSEDTQKKTDASNDSNEIADANVIHKTQRLANEHIFAMAADISGRLLVGLSGRKCALQRLHSGKLQTIFEPNDAKYIFAIVLDEKGNVYLGTGPEGKIFRLNSSCSDSELFYDSPDKNILSLAVTNDGSLLAGTDMKGLVYKIDLKTKNARVLYDAVQPEITSLVVTSSGDIYAAATSAQIAQIQQRAARQIPMAGRPETTSQQGGESSSGGQAKMQQLKIANTKKEADAKPAAETPARRPTRPEQTSFIYKITKEGFVTDVFSQAVVLFALAQQQDRLLLATGNQGELFTVEPTTEQEAVIFKDEQVSQITALAVSGDEVYIGTANPAKLIKLEQTLVAEGIYTSALVDAGQPADWGKLQIDADIPKDTKVLVQARSSNVGDVNHPSFSDWTKPVEVTEPVQLTCPLGRYCQYKLILKSSDRVQGPVIREVAVASTVPNLAPKVEEVSVQKIDKPDKQGFFKIDYKAKDDNQDTLIYKIDFRKAGRSIWIELKDKVETPTFEWDAKTVEDGNYEIRVTANDERSNSPATKLTGSRVSESFVVDNTGPAVEIVSVESAGRKSAQSQPYEIKGSTATIKIKVVDELSAIAQVQYTVNSNTEWRSNIPDDLVFDTMQENITIVLEELKAGDYVLTVKAADAMGNVTYKTIELRVKDK